ncbi:hypothetical protein C9I99_03445 [Photobacterium lutimaris]|uniref:Uncharacterized protein n=1 Tax=Photobacterium lutimaris TaxID=388278 RepID=A0A2T3J5C3_9GAMM|nr:hypothetical protein C9I99_03445 [Photobacterium lutimaris]
MALAIAVILAVAYFALPYHQSGGSKQELPAHQVSVKDLDPEDLAMVAELRLAHEEIRNLRQDNQDNLDESAKQISNHFWPSIEELASLWLAPFVKDKSWEHKGRHYWQHLSNGVYLGVPQRPGTAKPLLLISQHVEPVIWFNPTSDLTSDSTFENRAFERPATFSSSALIDAGWIQVSFDENAQHHLH